MFRRRYLESIIKQNRYVYNCSSNIHKNKHSLSYLIKSKMSQSDCIKLGIGLEKLLTDLILDNTKLVNIKRKNKKGKKEKDHLFLDKVNKQIFYAELKANLYLDTEKYRKTIQKCKSNVREIKSANPDCTVSWCLIGLRYLNSDDICPTIAKKYKAIEGNLFGINDYFDMLGMNNFSKEVYKDFLNEVAKKMFKKSS